MAFTDNDYIRFYHEGPEKFKVVSDRLLALFDTAIVVVDGIPRWKSSGHVPDYLVLGFWRHEGKKFNLTKSIAEFKRVYKADIKRFGERHVRRIEWRTW